jgi:uncharacterized surface protein with fasciclin (FAS1) repeats
MFPSARLKRITQYAVFAILMGCDKDSTPSQLATVAPASTTKSAPAPTQTARRTGLNTVVDVALGSKDHTTLVTALGAADYVDSLDNAGPFTVFAPTNAAFEKLPAGTVEGLLKADKRDALRNILKYHVTVSMYSQKSLTDGQVLGMANGAKATVHIKDGKLMINNANVVGTVTATNGIVHVIDNVLLPLAAQ